MTYRVDDETLHFVCAHVRALREYEVNHRGQVMASSSRRNTRFVRITRGECDCADQSIPHPGLNSFSTTDTDMYTSEWFSSCEEAKFAVRIPSQHRSARPFHFSAQCGPQLPMTDVSSRRKHMGPKKEKRREVNTDSRAQCVVVS